ncbi:hypothetical protein C8R43DRAFT_1156711 [Mycena crocata]|nr:hypothetical protein C8R43DRAFT_1156711 [Mycena crocata]
MCPPPTKRGPRASYSSSNSSNPTQSSQRAAKIRQKWIAVPIQTTVLSRPSVRGVLRVMQSVHQNVRSVQFTGLRYALCEHPVETVQYGGEQIGVSAVNVRVVAVEYRKGEMNQSVKPREVARDRNRKGQWNNCCFGWKGRRRCNGCSAVHWNSLLVQRVQRRALELASRPSVRPVCHPTAHPTSSASVRRSAKMPSSRFTAAKARSRSSNDSAKLSKIQDGIEGIANIVVSEAEGFVTGRAAGTTCAERASVYNGSGKNPGVDARGIDRGTEVEAGRVTFLIGVPTLSNRDFKPTCTRSCSPDCRNQLELKMKIHWKKVAEDEKKKVAEGEVEKKLRNLNLEEKSCGTQS